MKTPSRNSPGLPAHSLVTKRWMLGHLTWLALVLSQLILTTACAASEVTAWGWNDYGQTDVPSGLTNVVAIAGGAEHSLALTAEGRVVAWGAGTTNSGSLPDYGQSQMPSGLSNVVAIAGGAEHSLALTAEGQVVAWGAGMTNSGSGPDLGQSQVPSGLSNVVAIAAGDEFSLALTAEGRVVAWGDNYYGQTDVPSGLSNVAAIAAGWDHSLALTAEGRVVAWGYNGWGETNVPNGLSNVVAIAAGSDHSLALTAEGRVVAWGRNDGGQTDVPSGLSNVVAIAAGGYHRLALTAEGRVVAWGYNDSGQTNVPSGLSNVVAVAAGGYQSLALSGLPPGLAAPALVGPRFLVATVDRPFHCRIIAKNGVTTYGAAGLPPGLVLDSGTGLITGQPAQAGTYSMVLSATNSMGSSAWPVTLFVNLPLPAIASSGLVLAGLGSEFSYTVVAYNAPEWYGASGLPPGWVIDAQTGVISGAAVELGDFAVSLVASNRYGIGAGSLNLRVSPVVAWGGNDGWYLGPTWSGQTIVPSGLSNVVAIAAGDVHSLALTAEGRVVAWGAGMTNNGGWWTFDLGQSQVPSGLSNVVAIAAGRIHSLALAAEGRVVAWGDNEAGQTDVPIGLSNVEAIAAGWDHSLALTAEGQVVAWGAGMTNSGSGPDLGQSQLPSGLSNVVAIAAGDVHSLALTAESRVVAWGDNYYGQTDVPSGLSNVVAIAAGAEHSLALTAEGRVVAWGAGMTNSGPGPDCGQSQVPSGLSNVVAIAAGKAFSLALTRPPPGVAGPTSGPILFGPRLLVATADWPFHYRIFANNGVTAYGAAGLPPGLLLDPDTGLITGLPTRAGTYSVVFSATNSMGSSAWTVTLFVNEPAAPGIGSSDVVLGGLGSELTYAVVAYNAPEWYEASGLPPGVDIDAQTGVISGVPVELGDFVVSLVASNSYGRGTGSLTVRVSPVVAWSANYYYGQKDVPGGLSNVVAIAAGGGHNLALTAEGRVVAWGDNYYGQTNVPSGLSNVVAIAAGGDHSLALTAEGRVVGWGWNDAGQTDVPSGLSNVVMIAAGYDHSLALTAEGLVVGWGDNGAGQTNVPSGLSNVVAIAAGQYDSLALTAEGRVVAWGWNDYGQTDVPSGLSNVVMIAAGYDHSLALTAEGRVVAWGSYPNGWAYVPMTAPSGLSNVVAIAAGGYDSLALMRQPAVPTPRLELSRGMSGLELQARGAPGISCQLLRASQLPGPWLPAQPVTFTNSVQLLRAPGTSAPAQFFRLLRK